MSSIRVLSTIIGALFAANCVAAGNPTMGILRANLREYLRDDTLNAPIQPSDSIQPSETQPPDADGVWPDIDYSSRRPSDWPAKLHLRRMFHLARQGDSIGASRALAAWARLDPQSDNWWNQSIGTPKLLCETMAALGEGLDPATLESLRPILARSKPGMTAQNRTWLAGIHIMKGMLYEDPKTVREGRNIIAAELRIAPEGSEGIQPDFSFHQHGPQMQLGTYGLSFFREMTKWAVVFDGTEYAFPPEKLALLEGFYQNALRWGLYRGSLDLHACGRQLPDGFPKSKYNSCLAGAAALRRIGRLQDSDLSPEAIDSLSGSRYFPSSAYLVHRQPGLAFSLRMCTGSIIGSETVNNENLLGKFAGDGGCFLRTRGDEYDDALPLWNWRHYPGTTEAQDPGESLRSGKFRNGPGGAAAGLAEGEVAAAALRMRLGSLSADKAWICIGDTVAAFGCGISSTSKFPVHTSLDQRLSPASAIAGSGALPDGESTLPCPATIVHDGIEYSAADVGGGALRMCREERTGSWRLMNAAWPDAPRSGMVFDLYIDHGTMPEDARYFYTMRPQGAAKQRLKRVTTSTPNAVAVYDEGSGAFAAVFFEPGECALPDGTAVRAERPEIIVRAGVTVVPASEHTSAPESVAVPFPPRPASPRSLEF